MSPSRINKTISDLIICSRRKAEILIKEKIFLVNGIIAEVGIKVNPKIDIIKKEINQSHYEILMTEGRNRKTIQFTSFFPSQVIDLQIKHGSISLGELKEGEFIRIEDYILIKIQ